MSDFYQEQRKYQIENSSFSESFSINGTTRTIKGIFDRSFLLGKKDDGGVQSESLKARILVSEVPDPAITRNDTITREKTNERYTFRKSTIDDEGIPVLWLV